MSALPLTSNWFVSASYHIVAFSASSSSLVKLSAALSHTLAGSTIWASQSKVGKSLVIGLNLWTGKAAPFLAIPRSDWDDLRLI